MTWLNAMRGKTCALFTLLLLAAVPAGAQDNRPDTADKPAPAPLAVTKTDAGYVYTPEGCEFAITLPGEPYRSTRCDPDNPSDCRPQTTYTKVYGLDATVNFNITCNVVTEDMFHRYSGDVMEITLAAMANKNRLDDYETGFQQFGDDAKQAVILGTGKTGSSEKLFISQIWIGHKSLFTVEGEVVGPSHEEAETLLADSMSSIRHIDWKPGETPPATGKEPADGDKDKKTQKEKIEKKKGD